MFFTRAHVVSIQIQIKHSNSFLLFRYFQYIDGDMISQAFLSLSPENLVTFLQYLPFFKEITKKANLFGEVSHLRLAFIF